MPDRKHIPVMLNEALDVLKVSGGKVYVDGTVGGGGFSRKILEMSEPGGVLIGIDRDAESLKKVEIDLGKEFDKSRFKLFHSNFDRLDEIVAEAGFEFVNGIVLDLGISSIQLEGGRGFGFNEEGFLDMRMDKDQELKAFDIVNNYSEKDLADIIWKYGDERLSRRIARNIVIFRGKKPVETPMELNSIIKKSCYKSGGKYRIDPATRTFMALRIFVNNELESLRGCLEKVGSVLKRDGVISVISFHSGEDRIVKNFFKNNSDFEWIFKKPLTPSGEEIESNPRSRSAKLRAYKRV